MKGGKLKLYFTINALSHCDWKDCTAQLVEEVQDKHVLLVAEENNVDCNAVRVHFAGKVAGYVCRDYNITKNEWVLGGKTVYYASADTISDTLAYDMGQEREFNYANMNIDEAIRHLTRFCANLWQIHAFCEGNTRTTAVFMIKYLRTLGFNVVNDVFAENSWYFRNALVRANYSDLTAGISETTLYLERFFRSMLLGEEHDLRNRIMHVDWGKVTDDATSQSANKPVLSAKLSDELPPKCKNCTLEEVAVFRIMLIE